MIMIAICGWLALGAYGIWLANRHLNTKYPEYRNRLQDAMAYGFIIGGPGTLLGALFYIARNPIRKRQ